MSQRDLLKFANQVVDRCHSTNDLAKQLAENGFPHGTWVSARFQDQGRGRLGRKWTSIEGNLFLSYLTRIEKRELWSWIPLTTAVAMTQCLSILFPNLEVAIKWPNDIWLVQPGFEGKLGGILCEGASSHHPYVVVGIGMNCSASPDSREVGQSVADLTRFAGVGAVSADQIRVPLIQSLGQCFERLVNEGTEWVVRAYNDRSLLAPGIQVVWGDAHQEGRVLGLGPAGELQVQCSGGELRRLFAEEVRVPVARPS